MSKKGSYIDIRISGTLEIIAKNREDAVQQVKDRILKEILIEHPTFAYTGLPDLWEDWLNDEVEKMVGIEIHQTDESIQEEVNVRWSNREKASIEKDTRRRVKKGGKKTGGKFTPRT